MAEEVWYLESLSASAWRMIAYPESSVEVLLEGTSLRNLGGNRIMAAAAVSAPSSRQPRHVVTRVGPVRV